MSRTAAQTQGEAGVCGPLRRRLTAAGVPACAVLVTLVLLTARRPVLSADERVVFFPTYAHRTADGQSWAVTIHGWVFEPEEDSAVRAAGLDGLRRLLGLKRQEATSALFTERARAFLVDNERGKSMSVRLAGTEASAGISAANGHFGATIHIPAATTQGAATVDGWLPFELAQQGPGAAAVAGRVQLIESTGLSVISDIDDTIRVSHVLDRMALMKSTFLREFEAVPGMAALYRRFADQGARFHYVSGSPWQLYEPLAAFLDSTGLPHGSFHLRQLRMKDASVLEFLSSPADRKLQAIEGILADFPQRRFILVGDSGEHDPEIYGTVASRHGDRVIRIIIRDVTGEAVDAKRYRQAFGDLEPERWQLFSDATRIRQSDP